VNSSTGQTTFNIGASATATVDIANPSAPAEQCCDTSGTTGAWSLNPNTPPTYAWTGDFSGTATEATVTLVTDQASSQSQPPKASVTVTFTWDCTVNGVVVDTKPTTESGSIDYTVSACVTQISGSTNVNTGAHTTFESRDSNGTAVEGDFTAEGYQQAPPNSTDVTGVSLTWSEAGNYTVSFTSNTDVCPGSIVVNVTNSPIAIDIGGPSTLSVNQSANFPATVDGVARSGDWNFGDGTTSSASSDPSHAWTTAGTYSIFVDDGAGATGSKTVTVTDPPPGTPQITIGDIPRVPIYGGTSPIERDVTITVGATPIPQGSSVQLSIENISGEGQATFDSGSATTTVSSSTTVKLRGVANSNQINNLKLKATFDGTFVAEKTFSVRTWPSKFRERDRAIQGDMLVFDFVWDSESGNLAHLTGIGMGEHVVYPQGYFSTPLAESVPPWPNPTHSTSSALGTSGASHDVHKNTGQTKPYSVISRTAKQQYIFKDLVLMPGDNEWQEVPSDSITMPIDITREVLQNMNQQWIYKCTKWGHTVQRSCPL
jgi:hypothetical protein